VQYFELNDSTPTKRKHYELAEEYSDYEVGLFLYFFVLLLICAVTKLF
jgi:hypothetical protein